MTPVQLASNTQVGTGLTTVYQSPAGVTTTITAFTLNNPSSRSARVWIHVVPQGADVGDNTEVGTEIEVPTREQVLVPGLVAQVLPALAELRLRCDVPEAVTPLVSGVQEEDA